MTTRTENEVRNFNEAINKCRMPVFLVSSDGTQYNMKSAEENNAGMDLMTYAGIVMLSGCCRR